MVDDSGMDVARNGKSVPVAAPGGAPNRDRLDEDAGPRGGTPAALITSTFHFLHVGRLNRWGAAPASFSDSERIHEFDRVDVSGRAHVFGIEHRDTGFRASRYKHAIPMRECVGHRVLQGRSSTGSVGKASG